MSKTEKLAATLETGAALTAEDIKRLGVKNPTDAIFRLRQKGYCIYANKTANGTKYRIGKPTKAMVAQLFETFGSAMYDRDFFAN